MKLGFTVIFARSDSLFRPSQGHKKKKCKERITVIFMTNATGTIKFKATFIGKFCFLQKYSKECQV